MSGLKGILWKKKSTKNSGSISNTTTLQGASTNLHTDEVGWVARDTIRQVGSQVIFLSDNGIYSTQFFDEYNLRGTETPLSEPINVTIKRINGEVIKKILVLKKTIYPRKIFGR